jgi:hypothetical protein
MVGIQNLLLSDVVSAGAWVSQGTEQLNNLVGYENSGGALTAREQLAS